MSLRCVIISKHLHWSYDLHAGCIRRYDNDALLLMLVGVLRIGLAHDEVELRTRVTGTGDVPFVAVDEDGFAVGGESERGADVGCVGGSDWRVSSGGR